jgi:hypothetical protein
MENLQQVQAPKVIAYRVESEAAWETVVVKPLAGRQAVRILLKRSK